MSKSPSFSDWERTHFLQHKEMGDIWDATIIQLWQQKRSITKNNMHDFKIFTVQATYRDNEYKKSTYPMGLCQKFRRNMPGLEWWQIWKCSYSWKKKER